jgi:malate dehydrogenase (oxaloacetate-decarboxylating)(NADP+)
MSNAFVMYVIYLLVFIFPGLGLGATICGAKKVTDRMLYVAAEALANFVTKEELSQGKVFPHISIIRTVSQKVAVAVIKEAIRDNQATKLHEKDIANLDAFVISKMYDPVYVPLVEKRELML